MRTKRHTSRRIALSVMLLLVSLEPLHADFPKLPRIPGVTEEAGKSAKTKEKKQAAPKAPPSSPVDELARRDVVNSAVTGAVVGAVLGGVIANNVGDGKEEVGIVAGGILGAIVGGSIGKVAADRRKAYGTESKYLEAEIASANTAIDTKEKEIQAVEQDLAKTKEEIAALEEKRRQNTNVAAEARAKRLELDKQLAGYDDTLKTYQGSIDYLNGSIAESLAKKATNDVERRELEALQTDLLAKRNQLSAQYAQLSTHRGNVAEARDRLVAME